GIIGISGLMLPMSMVRKIDAACLMGITSGYIVDPKSAQAVLGVLSQALGIEVDMQALEEHAAEMEKVVAKLQEMQQMYESMSSANEDLRYIG
ncbi:proteasome assembly chaperone family protein, partial [Methanosarcinales archaeon]